MTQPIRLFRWLGAKSHMVPVLAPVMREQLNRGGRLVSLFYGTGALEQTMVPHVEQIAAEANLDLRAFYRAVASSPAAVDSALRQLDASTTRTSEGFTSVRAIEPESLSDAERGARFLWLSGFAFNGVWRVNRAGVFNVPADPARLARPWPLPSREQLEALGARTKNVRFVDDWRKALELAGAEDLILSDPPYLGGFVGYTADGFSIRDQEELALKLGAAVAGGAAVIAFNSIDARPLYALWADVTDCHRSGRVNSRASGRAPVSEMVAFAGLRARQVTASRASVSSECLGGAFSPRGARRDEPPRRPARCASGTADTWAGASACATSTCVRRGCTIPREGRTRTSLR